MGALPATPSQAEIQRYIDRAHYERSAFVTAWLRHVAQSIASLWRHRGHVLPDATAH